MKSRQKWIFTLILFSPLFIFANPKFITVFESNTSDLAINWIYNPVNPMEPVGLFQGKVQFKDLNINIEKKTVLLKSYGNNWNLTEINGNEKTKILKAKWYNFSGDLIGNLKMDWGFDSPLPEFILPENEDNIIYFDLFNSFKIFNKTGDLLKETKILENYKFNYENNIHYSIANNSQNILLGCTHFSADSVFENQVINTLVLTSFHGEKIFSTDLKKYQITRVHALEKPELYCVSTVILNPQKDSAEHSTLMLNNSGEIINTLPFAFEQIYFDPLDHCIFLMNKRQIVCYNILSGQLLWKYSKRKEALFLKMIFVKEKNMVFILQGKIAERAFQSGIPWHYDDLKIIAFDTKGNEFAELSLQKTIVYTPVFEYDKMQEVLFFGHSAGYKIIQFN